MAYDSAANLPRRNTDGFRRVDNLETSLRTGSKRISSPGRVRMHGAVRKGRHHFDTLRHWIILGIIVGTVTAALTVFTLRGYWG